MITKPLIAVVILLIFFALAGTSRGVILGNATALTLPPAQPLSGIVSQALGPNTDGSLPVAGQDYRLATTYFDNNTWAVGSITPINNDFEASTVVLKKTNGIYQVAVDPSNALPSGKLQGLPADVALYLRARIAVYQQVPGQ